MRCTWAANQHLLRHEQRMRVQCGPSTRAAHMTTITNAYGRNRERPGKIEGSGEYNTFATSITSQPCQRCYKPFGTCQISSYLGVL